MTTVAPDPRRWRALALLAVAQFAVVLDASIMNIALPSIGTDMGVSTETLAWVVNAYVLAFGGLLLLGGRAADLLGRRAVFMGGLTVFSLASLAGGLAQDEVQLIAARAIQGVGAAALAPAALSVLTTLFTDGAERNRALGIWGAVAGSGGVAGVLLGGVLTSWLGWESVLLINVPIGLAAAALAPRLFDETRVTGAKGFDTVGAVTVTAGLVAGVYALVGAPEAGWASTQTLGLLAASSALLATFVLVERRAANPLLPMRIFRMPELRAANAAMIAMAAAMFGLFFVLSLYLQQVLGMSALEAGASQVPMALVLVVAAGGVPALIDRIGLRPVLIGGLSLFAGGLAWMSQISADGTFLVDVLGPSIMVGAGLALAFVPLTIAAVDRVAEAEYGLASGLINTSQQIGGALGLAILTAVANARIDTVTGGGEPTVTALNEGFQAALLGGAGLAGVAVIAAAVLLPRRPAEVLVPATA